MEGMKLKNKMEEKDYSQKPKNNYEKYFLAEAAEECINAEGRLIKGKKPLALELLGGVYSGEALYDLFIDPEMAKSSPYALEQAIKILSKKSQIGIYQEKIGKLYEFFEDGIKRLPWEVGRKLNFIYNSLKDKTYGEVYEEFFKAEKILSEAEEGKQYKKEEIEKAKQIHKKYVTFIQAYHEMHDLKLESLRYKALSKRKGINLEKIVENVKFPEPTKK